MKVIIKLVILFLSLQVYSQKEKTLKFYPQKKYTQKFIDSLIINPAIKLDIEGYRKMLESNKNLLGWVHYYYGKSTISYRSKKYDSAIYYADKGIVFFQNSKKKREIDEKDLMRIYLNKGSTYKLQGENEEAIVNFLKAFDLTKKYPYKWKSFITTGIAVCHMNIGNDSIALRYYLKAEKDSLYMSLSRSAVICYNHIGVLYSGFNNTNLAKHYYKKGIEVSETSKYKNNLAALYGNLGFLYEKEDKRDSANYFFKKALQSYNLFKSSYKNAALYKSFYENYITISEGSYQKGILGLDSIYKKITTYNNYTKDDKDLMLSVIKTLAIAYNKKGDNKQFVNLLKQSNNFLTSFYEDQLKTNLVNLEIKHKTKEKETAILLLEKEKENQEKIIKQQNIINYSLIVLFTLLALFGWLVWKQRKIKNKYEIENLKSRLLRSQMNPHFLFNSLNTITSLVYKNSSQTVPYINKLATLLRSILINSRQEFVSIDEEISMLENYLEIESSFSKRFEFSFKIDSRIDREGVIIPPMLIQPFVENSILHGFVEEETKKKILIEFIKTKEKGVLLCKIQDNGVGYSKKINEIKKYKSLSGDIVKERLAILKKKFKVNAKYEITVYNKKGTNVKLYIPYILD